MKVKNYSLQFYRMLFTLVVCLYHFGTANVFNVFDNGYVCVEFFFILSGYFLYKNFERNGKTVGSMGYLVGRVKRLYPEYAFAAVIAIVSFGIIHPDFNLVKAITELLLLQNTGIFWGGYNTPCWYISALVVVSVIIYGFLTVNRNLYVRVIAPLMVFCGYAYFFKTAGGLEQWDVVQFVPMTLLRAACGLSLGILVSSISVKEYFLKINRVIATLIELVCLTLIGYGLTVGGIDSLLVLCFAVLVFVSVSNRSYFSGKLLNHSVFDKIASISYAVYVNQRVCHFGVRIINEQILHIGDKAIFLYLAALIVYSIITHKLIQTIVAKIENRRRTAKA